MVSAKCFKLVALMASAVFLTVPSVASAATIDSVTTGSLADNSSNAEGQSFLTPNVGIGWNNIEFNWYTSTDLSAPTTANLVPYAPAGSNVFIFTEAYTGTPGGLDSLTAAQKIADDFIAESTGTVADGSGNAYTFALTLALQANTEYFIYSDTVYANPIVSSTGGSGDLQRYRALGSSDDYLGPNNTTTVFTLQGTPVPEPITISIFGAGLVGAAVVRRRKKAKQA
jgi:hypothetical protein